MACVYVYVIVMTFLGPEYLGREFHVENNEHTAVAAGEEHGPLHKRASDRGIESSDDGRGSGNNEKNDVISKV